MKRTLRLGVLLVWLATGMVACGRRESRPTPTPAATQPIAARDTANPEEPAVAEAVHVLRAYYNAIDVRNYDAAYRLWASEGAASGKTLEVFRAGFENTDGVEVDPGVPGPLGAAAGSRYVEIPVQVRAVTRDGKRQEFSGTYTLRRSVVDGATADQRAWRIYSASIHQDR